MIKHIVMWKLKDEAEGKLKSVNAAMIKEKLEALKVDIAQITELEVGIGIDLPGSTFDVVMYSKFESQADLDYYQTHPKHKKIGAFIKLVVCERTAVDYIV